MEQFRQRRHDQRELEIPPPLIPSQQRRLFDDEIDTDLSFEEKPAAIVDGGLSEREESILTFEKQWWRHAGAKEQAIKDNFDLSGTRYYQILNSLLDKPEALEHDPVLVSRLRRLRGSRSRARER